MYAPLTSAQKYYYKSLLDRTILDTIEEERKKRTLQEPSVEKENVDVGANGTAEDVNIKYVQRASRRSSSGNVRCVIKCRMKQL